MEEGRKYSPVAWALVLVVLGLAAPLPAQITKCVGPDGETTFVNTGCPENFRPEGLVAGTGEGTGEEGMEPYICRFAGILSEGEIVPALAEARSSLDVAGEGGDMDGVRYWKNCLSSITARETELHARASDPGVITAGPDECEEGEYELRDGSIYYTNPKRAACRGLSAVCTFEVRETQYVPPMWMPHSRQRWGDYYTYVTRQHIDFYRYNEKIGKFATVFIGTADITGTVISWKCSRR